MQPSVYGTIHVAVSVPVESKSDRLGFLQAGYILNEHSIKNIVIELSNGQKVKVHDWDVDLESYFDGIE